MVLTFLHERNKRIEKARAEGYAEGRAEARAKVHAEWSEWNRRREEAERRGARFDEPHPRLDDLR